MVVDVDGRIDGRYHGHRVCHVPACHVVGRTVVRRSPDYRQACRIVDPEFEGKGLERDKSLVVIHSQGGIEAAVVAESEEAVRRIRSECQDALFVCGLDGTPVEEWEVIASYEECYTNDTFVTDEAMFECPESGVYSFAIVPKINNGSLYVKTVTISEVSANDISITSISGAPTLIPEPQAGS